MFAFLPSWANLMFSLIFYLQYLFLFDLNSFNILYSFFLTMIFIVTLTNSYFLILCVYFSHVILCYVTIHKLSFVISCYTAIHYVTLHYLVSLHVIFCHVQ